jgi:hypothetical protein
MTNPIDAVHNENFNSTFTSVDKKAKVNIDTELNNEMKQIE